MRLVPVVLAFVLSLPALADFCDLNLRYEENQIRWRAITGAVNYNVLELYGASHDPVYSSTKSTFINVTRRASGPVMVRYIVTVEVEPGVRLAEDSSDACTGSIDVTLPADPAFRKFTRRAIIPVVGSTAGAFGGRFKTALELRGDANEKGKLVFHPAGRAALDTDPSIPYFFTAGAGHTITYDDVVAAIGQSGIGSLDIVPDEDSADRVPEGTVRLYNETSLGTFGTFSTPVLPYDYRHPQDMTVRIPDARFRANIGIRALEATQVTVLIYTASDRLDGFKNLSFPAGWMEMKSASDFIGRALEPGQLLVMTFSGAAVPFYTITENATNDPTLVLAPAVGSTRNLATFVE
jgi:hypothetical protein